ncbi:hypothetical protein [Treponema sp. R6D11]
MKKLIVLSVIFALVAGSVFAADVGVEVFGGVTLLKGSSEEREDGDSYTTKYHNSTAYGINRVRINASGQTEDGTIGGSLRFNTQLADDGVKGYGWVWWKPSELFRLQIGSNAGDGEFGLEGVTGWGFYALANEVITNNGNTWGGGAIDNIITRNAFYGGWNAPGFIITSKPIEPLTINLAFHVDGGIAYKEYKQFTVQVTYNIDGVGLAGITYENSLFEHDGKTGTQGGFTIADGANNDNPYVRAYFGLTSIENLGVDVGIGYKFPDTFYVNSVSETGGKKTGIESTYTVNNPLYAGVGVNFTSGALGVRSRIVGEFLGNNVKDLTVYTNGDSKTFSTKLADNGWGMIIDVLPSYAINETITAYLSLGIGFRTGKESVEKYDDDGKAVIAVDNSSEVAWHVQPYIVITPAYWSGAFFAGIKFESPANDVYYNGDKGDVRNRTLYWSIPIGITASF